MEASEPAFREEQRLRQLWLWLLCLPIAALGWWAFLEQIVYGRPWGDKPAPDWVVVLIWLVFGIGLPAFLWGARMIVTVSADEIDVRWIPIWRRRIPLDRIRTCEARRYRPIREYLGWGIRLGPSGTAYSVSGDEGAQLVLDDGKRVLVGSKRAEELAEAVNGARGSS
ncbi:MAG: DUF6141 family protein [Planctomycetota bacterium]|jgi:hypothetical protein